MDDFCFLPIHLFTHSPIHREDFRSEENSAALTKDLGRQPQPWEVYLAHQQGIGGATALLHADPNANAGDVVGDPKAITGNGGTSDMSAGRFINYIKGYVDRHSMMYAANGAPTAQNLKENYETGLQAVTDLARREHPGDPTVEQQYRSHYIQQIGQQLHAENMTNQANWNILNAALNGPNAIKSEQDLLTNPRLVDAYNAIVKTDPSAHRVVNNAINANASAMWDPPATAQTSRLYDNLNGMQYTDRDRFANLNLMQYCGGMPVSQLNQLMSDQNKIRNHDATQAAKLTNLNSSITAIRDLTTLAAASAESPFYKMDDSSPSATEQQKWSGFASKFAQAIDDWQQNNSGKIPRDMQKREIAQGILFPNGTPRALSAGTEGNPSYKDTNTSTNTLTGTNVVDSNGKAGQADEAQDLTEVFHDADSADRNGPNGPNKQILAADAGPQGISGRTGETHDALSRGRSLNDREKDLLRPYISEEDLNNARIHIGGEPWYLPKSMDGITRGNDIYFRPGVFVSGSPEGTALLGHELVHVGQYREGMNWATYLLSNPTGYDKNSRYEKPAYGMQKRILDDLTKQSQ